MSQRQMRNQRLREAKKLAQGHTAGQEVQMTLKPRLCHFRDISEDCIKEYTQLRSLSNGVC